MAEFLPIIMFKQRSDDNQRVEGGGGDKVPGWYLQGDDLLLRSEELATGLLDGIAVPRKNPELPYLFEVQLDGDDTSKTKRSAVAGMLGDSAANERPSIIGMRGTDSLIVQAKDETAVRSMVDGVKDTDRNVAGISCVKKVSAFSAEVDLSESEDYKVRLVDYRNYDDNLACQRAFEESLAAEYITFFRCEYSSDLVIYDVEASPEQAQAMLDGIMGESIFSIKPMPRYEMTLAISDMQLWEAGMTFECVKARATCRYAPCTLAQDVRCCAECPTGCANPCKAARKPNVRRGVENAC